MKEFITLHNFEDGRLVLMRISLIRFIYVNADDGLTVIDYCDDCSFTVRETFEEIAELLRDSY